MLALACGYEDLNDHAALRADPLLAAASGKLDPCGEHREHLRDRGKPLASPSTLNRLELTPADADASARYKKIVYKPDAIESLLVDEFLRAHPEPLEEIILDLDATDDPIHGKQEGRFFHGFYDCYCYLPLYIFCGDSLLSSKLRRSNIDASAGALEEIQRIVAHIRSRWPSVRITLRADSSFARDTIMTWCEATGIDYFFGLARNSRLEKMVEDLVARARTEAEQSGQPVRDFRELEYRTLDSWSRARRVIAKAEFIVGKANPRFVVTSFTADRFDARTAYEDQYCARGDMENRIKEQQLALFAHRTSAHTMRANQLRLWFASIAYLLINALRHFGLRGTELEGAQAGTIRSRLLKIGAIVSVTVRRIVVQLSSFFPLQQTFRRILELLPQRLPLR